MRQIPSAVQNTFDHLKSTYPFYIVLTGNKGHYYVYRHQGKYIKETGKTHSIRTYLGRITQIGEFLARAKLADSDIEKAKAIIMAHGGTIIMPEENVGIPPYEGQQTTEETIILEALSTNARVGVSEISKRLGISYTSTLNRIKKLEEKYGITYTIEYGFLDRFNFYRFFAVAKFTDRMPDAEDVKKLIEKEPRIQLALWARGDYNLFLFMLASTPIEAENIVYNLRSDPTLKDYPSEWHSSYHTHGFGYIPLRKEYFDLIKNRIWYRTKETPRKQQGQIFYREYATLKELNQNGLAEFSEIDKKYKLNRGSAQHTYHELLENKNIWRVTVTMKKPPIKDIAVIILEQMEMGKFNDNKRDFLMSRLDQKQSPLNKFLYSADIGSPYGILLIAPLYKEGDLESLEATLSRSAKGVKIKSSIISNVLVGNLGFRKIDITKTLWYLHNKNLLIGAKTDKPA